MVCVTNEHMAQHVAGPTHIRAFERLAHLLRGLAVRLARPDRLDLEGMPDRVKRDLGFMDGRDPYIEDARTR